MRALLLATALALACKRDKPIVRADPDQKLRKADVVITVVPPRVGTRARVTLGSDIRLTMTTTPGLPTGGPATVDLTEHSERTEEILAVTPKTVTEVRVTYDVHESTSTLLAAPMPTSSAVVKQTFVVRATTTGLEIVDAHGKPASADARVVLERDYKMLGKEDEVSRALPTTPLQVGDLVPTLSTALRTRFSEASTVDAVGDLVVRVSEATRDVVGFTVKGALRVGVPAIEMQMTVDGRIAVRVADGHPTELAIAGPLAFSSDAGFDASGKMSYTVKWVYLTPPK